MQDRIIIKINNQNYESVEKLGCGSCVAFYDNELCYALAHESPIACSGIIWKKFNKSTTTGILEKIQKIKQELDAMEEELKNL